MGLGDLLASQVAGETDELRKRRMAQLAGRPVSAGLGYGLDRVGSSLALAFWCGGARRVARLIRDSGPGRLMSGEATGARRAGREVSPWPSAHKHPAIGNGDSERQFRAS